LYKLKNILIQTGPYYRKQRYDNRKSKDIYQKKEKCKDDNINPPKFGKILA
jgi:hypothetical protein